MDKNKKIRLIIKIAIFAFLVFLVIYLASIFLPNIKQMKTPHDFSQFVKSYGAWGALVLTSLQAAQIIIAIIPGEVVQIAGGIVFGTLWGTLYMVIGTIIGQLVVFYACRLLGAEIMNDFVPQDKMKKYHDLLNSPKSEIAMFILFLLPAVPKDILTYAAGFTTIDPMKFIVISTIGRFPGLLGSAFIGSNLAADNKKVVIITVVIITILLIIGLIYKDKIIHFIHEKMSGGRFS